MNTPTTSPNKDTSASPANLQDLLGGQRKRAWYRRKWVWALGVTLPVLAITAYVWQLQSNAVQAPSYVTHTVKKGDLALTISANGTLQPTRSVEIGSELSGTVKAVLVDVNDRVKKGQVLVELDTTKLRNQVQNTRAALVSVQAQVAQANATVEESHRSLQRMEEVHRLSGGKTPSATELDSARATLARAQANLASAKASVQQTQASLATDESNLTKAFIRSPIDGVVLSRDVEPGNAVAASLQAVTLFTVAENLTQLRLEASVDEADVGTVQAGQQGSFTVSAYPSRRYPATISRVAYGATTTDNVVTYKAYLDVNNADASLRPGMTATATITSQKRQQVLLVPNTALRFSPQATTTTASAKKTSGSSIVSSLMPRPPNAASNRPTPNDVAANSDGTRRIWVISNVDGKGAANKTPPSIKPIDVTPGISDGKFTEIVKGDLQEGMQVITDQHSKQATP